MVRRSGGEAGTTTHTSVPSAIDAAMCGFSDFGCFAVYPERVLAIGGQFRQEDAMCRVDV